MKRVIELILTRTEPLSKLWLRDLKVEMLAALRNHALFTCIALLYMASCVIVARIYGVSDKVSLFLYLNDVCIMTFWFFILFIIGQSFYVRFFVKPENFKEYLISDLQTNYLNAEHLCNMFLIVVLLSTFMSAFTSFKIIMPVIHPFSWDYTFAKIDTFIHGGVQPWRLLQPVLGHPIVTSALNVFYNLWFFVMYGFLYWQAFSLRDRNLRMQFLLTFVLLWIIIGTITATIFSSAGPCYYGYVVHGENIFQPLMDYLHSARLSFPVWSLNTQDMLWRAYDDSQIGQVKGISAMPSMHVSIAMLFALVGWRVNRITGTIFSIFAFIIMIACIHLGWHYAIDGYTAVILTLLIWWVVSRILNRYYSFSGFEADVFDNNNSDSM